MVNNLTTTDNSKALSAAQGKALNDKISRAFIIKNYTYAYTIAAGKSLDITGKNFGTETPTGYRPSAVLNARTGSDTVQLVRVHGSAVGTSVAMIVTNNGTSTKNPTAAISVLYIKELLFN